MNKTDHLKVAEDKYRDCIYSLAERKFEKALTEIDAALDSLQLHLRYDNCGDYPETYAKIREYSKLKTVIEQNGEERRPTKAVCRKTAAVTFDDVVGLEHIKQTVMSAIVYPFKYGDIYRKFRRKSGGGILLYGAPGTGKTMIARAIASEIDARFIAVNCSDVLSKWFGESQRNIKKIFDDARGASRAVIFFDEFEALGRSRSGGSDEISSVDGIVCELLAQIDGFFTGSGDSAVLVVAATNRPWDIDSALLRSGRFERHLYVAMPDGVARAEIIRKQMSGLPTAELCYQDLGRLCEGFSPADVAEACNLTKDRAILRSIRDGSISVITQEDFTEVLSAMHATVGAEELKRLELFV